MSAVPLRVVLPLALTAAGLAVASLFVGRGLGGALFDWPALLAEDPALALTILTEIRLPRTLLGLLVGATLGLCGAALQGLLRNPLAEPGLLGTSSGAALGAVVVFYFGLAGGEPLVVAIGGVVGAAAALAAVYGLAGRGGILVLILAGIALNALAGALTSLALNFAPSPYAALEIVFWMLGSLADRSLTQVLFAAPLMAIGWVLVLSTARGLDALALGEDAASSLGFSPARLQALVIVGTALAVGAAVAVCGVIGFVGLVVPHLLRPWVGHRPGALLVPSALAGAALTVAADVTVRLLPAGPELKLGVVTALLGAPFFLHLVVSSRRAAT